MVVGLFCARQVLSNGSLYVESAVAEEGTYQCKALVTGVGVLLSRTARVRIACKFIPCFVVSLLLCPCSLWYGYDPTCWFARLR